MDAKQLAWIETTLQSAREDWKICYFHHPLNSNADRHGASVDLRIRLEPLFVKTVSRSCSPGTTTSTSVSSPRKASSTSYPARLDS